MHSFHTGNFAFHHHGTPSGDLVVNPRGKAAVELAAFRLDVEEAVLFVAAVRLGSVMKTFETVGTRFDINGATVRLRALGRSASLSKRDPDDADGLDVPFADLAAFVDCRATDRHFQNFLEGALYGGAADDTAVGIAMLIAAAAQQRRGGLGTLRDMSEVVAETALTVAGAVLLVAAARMHVIRNGHGLLRTDGTAFEVRDGVMMLPGEPGILNQVRLEHLDRHVSKVLLPRWTSDRIVEALSNRVTGAKGTVMAGLVAAVLDGEATLTTVAAPT